MKIIHTYLAALFCVLTVNGLYGQSMLLNGERVLFKHVDRQTFSIALVISGGTANYTKSNEGIEHLALNWTIKGGTVNVSPLELAGKMDSLGMEIEVVSSLDYSAIVLTGLKKNWRSSFDVFTRLITNPALDNKVYDDIKDELVSNAFYSQQDAETKLFQLSIQHLFNGSDYEKIPEGSPGSIAQLQSVDVANYLKKLKVKQKGFLSVVGDFDNDELDQIKNFGNNVFQHTGLDFPNGPVELPGSPSINHEEIETNYLRGMILSPELSSDEGFPMLLGMEILSDRLFQRIRSLEGLSYSPGSYYAAGIIKNPYSVILLDTENPAKAMEIVIELLKAIIEQGVTQKELDLQKANYLTWKYLGEESTKDLCIDLYRAGLRNQLLTTDRFNQKIKEIKITDVNTVLAKYLKTIHWTYLGNTELINKESIMKASKIEG